VLLIGTRRGLRDLDSGETLVDGQAVTALAVGRGGWYALLDRRLVVRDLVPIGELPAPDGQSLAALADGAVVVGRTGGRLSVLGGAEPCDLMSFESVPGRQHWENPAAATPDTRSMAVGESRLFVNVHVGGVWFSDDTGVSWQAAVEPEADVHEVRTGAASQVAVAAAVGFGWSQDGGWTWSWTVDGLHAGYLRALCLTGDTVLVAASDGPFTKQGAVYRAGLGPAVGFKRCERGLPESFPGNVDTGRLDAAGSRVAFGFGESVYVSEDEGRAWRVAAQLSDPVTAVRFGALGVA